MDGVLEATLRQFPCGLIPGTISKRLKDGYNSYISFNSYDGLTKFFALRQTKNSLILQKTFLVADTRVEVLLEIHFFIFISANI